MACFIVPATEAIITTVAEKKLKAIETKHEAHGIGLHFSHFSHKLSWLNKMLWGGSGLLAFEHLWHGEITPFFPFLTAASRPEDAAEMLHEMATSGVGMAALVTAVWCGMVLVSVGIEKSARQSEGAAAEGAQS